MNAAGGRGFEDRAGGKVDDDTKMVNVPGLKAPTISIPSLLNSMPRLVLRAGGDLADSGSLPGGFPKWKFYWCVMEEEKVMLGSAVTCLVLVGEAYREPS